MFHQQCQSRLSSTFDPFNGEYLFIGREETELIGSFRWGMINAKDNVLREVEEDCARRIMRYIPTSYLKILIRDSWDFWNERRDKNSNQKQYCLMYLIEDKVEYIILFEADVKLFLLEKYDALNESVKQYKTPPQLPDFEKCCNFVLSQFPEKIVPRLRIMEGYFY